MIIHNTTLSVIIVVDHHNLGHRLLGLLHRLGHGDSGLQLPTTRLVLPSTTNISGRIRLVSSSSPAADAADAAAAPGADMGGSTQRLRKLQRPACLAQSHSLTTCRSAPTAPRGG